MGYKNYFLTLFFASFLLTGCNEERDYDMVLNVDLNSHEVDVPETLYGIFFEEINHAGDGGLYAELLMNRSFEDCTVPDGYKIDNNELVPPKAINYITGVHTTGRYRWTLEEVPGWELVSNDGSRASMGITQANPRSSTAPSQLKVAIENGGDSVSLIGKGYWGIGLKKDEVYKLRMFLRTSDGADKIAMRLTDSSNNTLGSNEISVNPDGKWHEYNVDIAATDTTSTGRLSLDFQGAGTYYFDYVSLFPSETFKNRPNGMRKDVAEMLENLHPAFVRWPGGCIVEGITLNNRVEWKKTLGDPADRPGQYDTWGYRNSYGFGYKEFLDFCEDLGAKAMYVCNVGIACYGRTGEFCDEKDVDIYIQDVLDAIEYAIGDTTSVWGRVRAQEGHPAKYPLEYVEIGNENFGPLYDKRYNRFYKAIKEQYPHLTLISDYGMGGSEEADTIEFVDPHWYVDPERFFRDHNQFDSVERGKYNVYVGEYSCNEGVGSGNMLAALSEAAFLTGVERNSDLVKMTSYAPLIENKNDRSWPVNLISVSTDNVIGRSSYYVQKLFANNRPTYMLQSTAIITPETEHEKLMDQSSGYIAFEAGNKEDSIRNIRVIKSDGKISEIDISDLKETALEHRHADVLDRMAIEFGDTVEFEYKDDSPGDGRIYSHFGLNKPALERGYVLDLPDKENKASLERLYWGKGYPFFESQDSVSAYTSGWNKVRVTFDEKGVNATLNGSSVLSYVTPIVNRKFYSTGYDETTKEVIIKVVNASDKPCYSQINLSGHPVKSSGCIITLKADSKQDENSFQQPKLIYPQERTFDGFDDTFNYTFEPNSLTIFRIKTE